MQESFTPNLLPPESDVCVLSDDNNYSKCFYCQERFGNTAEQIWPNPNTKPFHCHECDIKFYKLDHFVDHFTTHKVHGEVRQPFLCPTCNKGFENIIAFSQHVASHMEGKLYACPHCDESFEFESNLIGHQVLHNKKIDGLMKCESCEALFPIENFVADRLNSKELYSCEICLLDNFSDLLELCLHRAVLHPSYTYRCAQCRKMSVSSQKQNPGGNGGTLCEGDVESLCNGEDNSEVKNSEEPGDLSDNENLSQALSILGQQAGHENGRGAMLDLGVVCENTTSHSNKNNKKKRKPSVSSNSNTTAATVITNNSSGGGHVESRCQTKHC
ncbi:zinc finger and SCAN domain-containing protein 2-like [Octopus sinensis]|uniref:Zinc finger and SCAN domain-containing protein 2-like n=1 Tax=Octopus sinensis TaxID=2607531 RepID=A0A6P7TU39_9MOLL|nr:zinc finger and SCAN domain-containing protein 2-like [Octopus sinensis]